MSETDKSRLRLEIAHVLFVDVVGYSKLSINQQSETLRQLNDVVSRTEQFREADQQGKLIRLPTGDGMALVFRADPEAPAQCALEISQALKTKPDLRLRMGVHSGPVHEVSDVNQRANIAGAGINVAQRVMDCGDAGHILVSKHAAEDLEQYDHWHPHLHDLGPCEIKHGERLQVVNLYTEDAGNPALPLKFASKGDGPTTASGPARSNICLRRWIIGVAVGAVIVIGGLLGWKVIRHGTRLHMEGGAPATPESASPVEDSPRRAQTGLVGARPSIPDNSIAVLPFDNLSEEKANAYFAEGIQDEILTRLSKIAALKVISRTSTVKYKSAPDNLRDVGSQLGVANVLEGSVQKIANAVHINVQLIRAATDEHIWAESYNRRLDDVFAVEGEVASTIADQLNAKLTGAEEKAIKDKPTQNTAAYDAYLRGLAAENNGAFNSGIQEAAAAYASAVQLDPKFALAWARLAVARGYLYFNGVDTATNSPVAVKEAADRAIALQPELGEAWIAQGAYRYRIQLDYEGALQTYYEAQKRLPNSSFILQNMAFVEKRLGRWTEAEAHFRKVTELDPRDVRNFVTIGCDFLNYLRRFDDAQAALDRALEISPDDQEAIAGKASIFQREGRLEEAAKQLARIPADSANDFPLFARLNQAVAERRFDAAIALIEPKLSSLRPGESLGVISQNFLAYLGYYQEWAGRPEQALASFARAVQVLQAAMASAAGSERATLESFLAVAYAGLRDKTNALDQAHHALAKLANDAISKPQNEISLAQIQARFGDLDSAIAALPHLLEVPAGLTPADLRYDPMWDPLRKDPRFQKLCQQQPNK
jgi:TolB-like protein/class 3 adenylate cyclase/Tfp pilus assembly protein PilF